MVEAMDAELELIEKLRRIEARSAQRAQSDAGANGADPATCIRGVLQAMAQREPCVETRFSMPDSFCEIIFMVLLERYGLQAYRYSGERRTTVMVEAPRRFVAEVLFPIYEEMGQALSMHLSEITRRVLLEALPATPAYSTQAAAAQGQSRRLKS